MDKRQLRRFETYRNTARMLRKHKLNEPAHKALLDEFDA